MAARREYRVMDNGDEFNLELFIGRKKVGELLLLDGGHGEAFGWCLEMGEAWLCGNPCDILWQALPERYQHLLSKCEGKLPGTVPPRFPAAFRF